MNLRMLLALALFVANLGSFVVQDQAPIHADAIVVLGGGGSPRTQHAVDLYRQGYAPLVVFSGGAAPSAGAASSSARRAQAAAVQMGLPERAALLAPDAQSTYDEAVNLAHMAARYGWRSLLIVTDPPHTRRAGVTFRAMAPALTIGVSAAPAPAYDPAHWGQQPSSVRYVVSEVIKLGFYWVWYGISPFG